MSEVSFYIKGKPEPQGRPRFALTPKGVRAIDPAKSRAWKEDVHYQAINHRNRLSPAPFFEGAVSMGLEFVLHRPQSLPKKVVHHVKKPDIDNLQKAVKDGLKGVFFKDDSQICDMHKLSKRYCVGDEAPGVRVTIKPFEGTL